jgi:hypothetical protein
MAGKSSDLALRIDTGRSGSAPRCLSFRTMRQRVSESTT